MSEGGLQTQAEREIADRCLTVLRVIPNQTTVTLCANINCNQIKSHIVTTEQVFRACSSDDRITVDRSVYPTTYRIKGVM